MAQKYMSPGVFTEESDLSFLAAGVAGIGALAVGRTPKGPAFVPTFVNGLPEFVEKFGAPDPEFQVTYAAKNYLKNSTSFTVVRTLGHDDGTTTTNGYSLPAISAIADFSASQAQVLAILHHTGTLTIAGVPTDADNFTVSIPNLVGVTASFLTSSANYVKKVLNTDPTKYSTYGHYLAQVFSYTKPAASASWQTFGISGSTTSFTRNFEGGVSAWITSQPAGGQVYDLFRFNTIPHGRSTNDDFKVMISNIRPSPSPLATPYGTFDVIVRGFGDTDQRQQVLETHTACTLDPTSKNYILRKIGNHVETFDTTQRKFIGTGDYVNKSKYVTVEMNTTQNAPPDALPWGHRGYAKEVFPTSSGSIADMKLTINLYDRAGNVDNNICWGISFVSGGVADRMRAFPNSAVTSSDADFSLSNLTSSYVSGRQFWSYSAGLAASQQHSAVYASSSLYRFTVPFRGGFDGWDLRVDDPTYLTNVADDTDIGVVSLKRALDTMANPDAFDMNLLVVPAVHNLKVTDKARSIVNDRGDALYIMDITGSSVVEAVGQLKSRELDDNYTATYYPDVKINDRSRTQVFRASPSTVVIGAMAFNDRVGAPWFAPAGLNRGGLGQFDVFDTVDRLTFSDRNDLYDNRINPIASFPNEGVVVFGQKTLQVKASSLDRVNVRRLLIYAKKTVASAAKLLLFEPNNPATWQRFLNAVNPILDNIRQNNGLNRFKVVMDTSTNTADLVDRNIMTGKIFLEPTKAAEFISLDFVITNAGVSFGE